MENEENTGQVINIEGRGEIISIGLGDSGINTLYYFFDEIAKEHNIIKGDDDEEQSREHDMIEMTNLFFREKKKPRAILVDSGSKSKILDSKIGKLIDKANIINSKGKNERLWGVQYTDEGKSLINATLEAIRKESEKCSSLGGFQIFHNIGGGLGSGVTCGILQKLNEEFPKNVKLTHTLIPAFQENEPYGFVNSLYSMNVMGEHANLCNIIKNESVTNYCKFNKIKVESGKFNVENQIIGKMVADLTSSMRFKGLESFSFEKLEKIMTPYPRIKFVSPYVVSKGSDEHVERVLIYKLLRDNSCLGLQNISRGKIISNYAVVRGEYEMKLIDEAIKTLYYENRNFFSTDWSGNNFYWNVVRVWGLTGETAVNISNNSNFREIIANINSFSDSANGVYDDEGQLTKPKDPIFDRLLKLGVEQSEFSEARENLAALEKDYEEIAMETDTGGEGEEY